MTKATFAKKLCLSICCLLLFAPMPAAGQVNGWQEYYDVLIEENGDDEGDAEQVYEQLSDLASHPVNINAVSREELEQMYFFDERQTDAILDYIDHYGPVRSKGELAMIPFLDDARAGLLACLTTIGAMPERPVEGLDSLARRAGGEQFTHYIDASATGGELLGSVKIPFYNRRGYIRGYTGYKCKHGLRFNYRIDSHLKVGAVAAQDAGEPFFYGKNRWGYDYRSAYIRLQRVGFLKNLVVGNYRMRTGLGLVMNSSLGFGKAFGMSSLHSPASVITPHTSRSGANHLQGAAATFAVSRRLDATVFASCRHIDATMDDDGNISTVLKTGYHRTASELERKDNALQTTAGASVSYTPGLLRIGATALWNHYDHPLKPYRRGSSRAQLYRMFYPTGTDFFNASVNYGYKYGKTIYAEGETAVDEGGNVATVNTVTWQPHRRFSLTGIQRYYPYKFCATLGKSFSDGGRNQNENGVCLAAAWTIGPRLSLYGYSDAAYFRWPRYQTTASSHSFDNLVQATYKVSASSALLLRYRIRLREKDDSQSRLRYRQDQRLRAAWSVRHGRLSWKTQADVSFSRFTENSAGGMLSETLTMTLQRWKLVVGAAYFHTDDYASRVYAYEQSTPYNLSFPSFSGHGCRGYALAEVALPCRLTALAKLGYTHYFDRDSIGSALQTIDSSSQTDLDIMLKWTI